MLQSFTSCLYTHKLDRVTINLELNQEDREISVDAHRVAAVIVNLIANAAEAMPAGGDLTIRSRFDDKDGLPLFILSITDTGCGIDREDLRQIHEPFFTTKSKGTGLGIPVCQKVIEAHEGRLNFKSKIDEGTTVEIWLPAGKPE